MIRNDRKFDPFLEVVKELVSKPDTVFPREFLREIVLQKDGDPQDPEQIVDALTRFYDNHTERSDNMDEFLDKCSRDEVKALRAVALRNDPEYQKARNGMSRRMFIRLGALAAGGIAASSGALVASSYREKAMDEMKNSTPDQSAAAAKIAQKYQARANTAEEISVAGAAVGVLSVTSLMDSIEILLPTVRDAATKEQLRGTAIKLLADTDALVEAATKQMREEERVSRERKANPAGQQPR